MTIILPPFMPGPKPRPVELSSTERTILQSITKRHSAPYGLVQRARIILLADKGLTKPAIAREMNVSTNMPTKWRARWFASIEKRRALQDEPDALAHFIEHDVLADQPRSGTPPTFTPEQITQIIALALREPEELGRPVTHWTPTELADEAVKQGIVESISPRSVGRFLKRGRPQAASKPLLDESRD